MYRPFVYIFSHDSYHDETVYFFRSLLNFVSGANYSALRDFFLKNVDYYTSMVGILSKVFLASGEAQILCLAFIYEDEKNDRFLLLITFYKSTGKFNELKTKGFDKIEFIDELIYTL